jgi:hypothetical protein
MRSTKSHAQRDVVETVDTDLGVKAPDDAREQVLLDELVVPLSDVGNPEVCLNSCCGSSACRMGLSFVRRRLLRFLRRLLGDRS